MSVINTNNLPLHEIILQILFLENTEKAASMTPEDVLWKIDNPEISERQIKEVLDWLVRQKKVTIYLNKYSLDRIEFLAQKEKSENLKNTTKKKNTSPSKKNKQTFYISPPKTAKPKYIIVVFILCIAAFGYITYTLLDFTSVLKITDNAEQVNNTTNPKLTPKILYTSQDDEYSKKVKSAISSSFNRQNKTNQLIVVELNRLQTVMDSTTNLHNRRLSKLQTEFITHVVNTNALIKQIIFINTLTLCIFVFLYFKKE